MTHNKRTIRFFVAILLAEILLVGAAILAFGGSDASAHTARPQACTAIWQAAPPGQKWEAKQRCLAAQQRHNCITHQRPVPRSIRVKNHRTNANQRHVIGWIVNEGLRRDLKRVFVIAALIATTQEAGAEELPYGDGTSVGPFQLIDDHGSFDERVTVEFSGNWFYNGALKEWRRLGPMSAPALAQEVEESGHPTLYRQWVPESRRTLAAVLGPCRLRR